MLLTIDVSHSFYLSLLYKMSKRPADAEIEVGESVEKKAKLSPSAAVAEEAVKECSMCKKTKDVNKDFVFAESSELCSNCVTITVISTAEEAEKAEEEEESITSSEDFEESKEDADKKPGVWVSVQISLRSLLSNRCYLIVDYTRYRTAAFRQLAVPKPKHLAAVYVE